MEYCVPNQHDHSTKAPRKLCTPPVQPSNLCPFCRAPGYKASGCKSCGCSGYPGEEPPVYRRRKWSRKVQEEAVEQEDLDEYLLVNPLSTEPE